MTTNTKIRVFKRSKIEILIGKYSYIFLGLAWFSYLIFELFFRVDTDHQNVSFTVVLHIFLAIYILNTLLFWKFAYQIAFDLEAMDITFFMYRKRKPIQLKINEIRQFLFGLYVIISYDSKNIYFNGYDDSEFISFLELNNFPIKWNKVGRYLTKNMNKQN